MTLKEALQALKDYDYLIGTIQGDSEITHLAIMPTTKADIPLTGMRVNNGLGYSDLLEGHTDFEIICFFALEPMSSVYLYLPLVTALSKKG